MLGPCFDLQYVVAIIKRELVALLVLCSECHIAVIVL